VERTMWRIRILKETPSTTNANWPPEETLIALEVVNWALVPTPSTDPSVVDPASVETSPIAMNRALGEVEGAGPGAIVGASLGALVGLLVGIKHSCWAVWVRKKVVKALIWQRP
jgi:hypothetical protein